jgi:hypothetical protein
VSLADLILSPYADESGDEGRSSGMSDGCSSGDDDGDDDSDVAEADDEDHVGLGAAWDPFAHARRALLLKPAGALPDALQPAVWRCLSALQSAVSAGSTSLPGSGALEVWLLLCCCTAAANPAEPAGLRPGHGCQCSAGQCSAGLNVFPVAHADRPCCWHMQGGCCCGPPD